MDCRGEKSKDREGENGHDRRHGWEVQQSSLPDQIFWTGVDENDGGCTFNVWIEASLRLCEWRKEWRRIFSGSLCTSIKTKNKFDVFGSDDEDKNNIIS